MSRSIPALVVALGLGLGLGLGTTAHAGNDKVDWSQYIEPAGYKTPGVTSARPAPAAQVASDEKPEKQVATKSKASPKAKAKAKAKTKAARGKHR